MSSFADSHSLFEKPLLPCYWAWVETKTLTAGHQMAVYPELLIISCVLSGRSGHKVGYDQQQSIIK